MVEGEGEVRVMEVLMERYRSEWFFSLAQEVCFIYDTTFTLHALLATGTSTISVRLLQERFEFSLLRLVNYEMKEGNCSCESCLPGT